MSIGKVNIVLALALVAASCKAPTANNPPTENRAWVVSTLAGTGEADFADTGTRNTPAQFSQPSGVAVDSSGNVYVADSDNHRIRKITEDGTVSTLAGSGTTGKSGGGFADGTGSEAQFNYPSGVAVDSSGNLYVADTDNHRIRKITAEGEVSTLAGTRTAGLANTGTNNTPAQFNYPSGVAVDSSGNVYVADTDNHRIRKITEEGEVSTLAGSGTTGKNGGGFADTGTNTPAQFSQPTGVAVDSSGNVYVADSGNNRIRKVTADGMVSTLAGTRNAGHVNGAGNTARFSSPSGVAVDSSDNVYVADTGNNRIRKITITVDGTTGAETVTVSTLAGDSGTTQFNGPLGVAVDSSGNVYVADTSNHRIQKVTADGTASTLAGSGTAGHEDGAGSSAQFNRPYGVAVDSSGNVYVADSWNNRIRKVTENGTVSTLAGSGSSGHVDGSGSSAQFKRPFGVAVDSSGNVYVGDSYNNRIRKVTADGVVSTLAGSGIEGHVNGPGSSAQFDYPLGVTVDSRNGNVYVADESNNRIRKIEYKVP